MSKPKPAPLRERDITRQIAREYYKEFDSLIESDVIIVGAGPSGLICAHDLAKMGFRTLVVEQSLALGGGFWHGGYLMNKATICAPAHKILEELGVPCKKVRDCEGMYIVDPPHATGALIAAAYGAGARVLQHFIEHFKAKAGARGYQTLINETLKQAIQAETLEGVIRKTIREELRRG